MQIHTVTIQQKGTDIKKYESHERNYAVSGEDIIGIDTNVLVDLVESEEFRKEIKEQIRIGVLKLYTTNVALGEAKHVLVKKRGYSEEKAKAFLQSILTDFTITKITHTKEGNELGFKWLNTIKNQMRIKKFQTFITDLKILSNLYKYSKINIFMTEDADIEKAANILKIPVRVRIIGEASQLQEFDIKRFFKEKSKERRKGHHRYQRRF